MTFDPTRRRFAARSEGARRPATRGGPDGSAITVLYISGYGRSGSTLLGKMLGQLPDAVYVGEVNFFWIEGVLGQRPCGCGRSMRECPLWMSVLDGFGADVGATAAEVIDQLTMTMRTRHGVNLLTARRRREYDRRLTDLHRHLGRLYEAIAAEFGARVIVDSSKSPLYGYIVSGLPGVRVESIHLVRDPRATADAWRRPKRESIGDSVLPQFGLAYSSLQWLVNNLLTRLWGRLLDGRYAWTRYEDLMTSPRAAMDDLGRQLGRDLSAIDIQPDGTVALAISHSIAGNPNRFDTGRVPLRQHVGWQERIRPSEHLLITGLTLPCLRLFGYSVRRAAPHRSRRQDTHEGPVEQPRDDANTPARVVRLDSVRTAGEGTDVARTGPWANDA